MLASEAGVLPMDPQRIRQKGRLMPGRMFLVDTEQGRIIDDEEVKADIVRRKPYRSRMTEAVKNNSDPIVAAEALVKSLAAGLS